MWNSEKGSRFVVLSCAGNKQKMNTEEEKDGGEEDERRETALASTQPLQPGFKPTHISQDQLSKLHELHRRRLKIKSKIHKKLKDGSGRPYYKDLKHDYGKNSVRETEDSKEDLKKSQGNISLSTQQSNEAALDLPKQRKKLHWGLDTRERWERKANM